MLSGRETKSFEEAEPTARELRQLAKSEGQPTQYTRCTKSQRDPSSDSQEQNLEATRLSRRESPMPAVAGWMCNRP